VASLGRRGRRCFCRTKEKKRDSRDQDIYDVIRREEGEKRDAHRNVSAVYVSEERGGRGGGGRREISLIYNVRRKMKAAPH